MSALLIGNAISSIRNNLKANKVDTFLTDYEIYCLYKKHAAPAIKRLDEKGHLSKFSSVFETLVSWILRQGKLHKSEQPKR